MIADFPDNESAAAMAIAVNSSGAVATRTVVLLTPEEVDRAVKRSMEYRALRERSLGNTSRWSSSDGD